MLSADRVFEKELNHFYERVLTFHRRACREDVAEDLTQDTFKKVWLARERFEGRSSLATFIYSIASNVLSDYLRTKQRRPTVSLAFAEGIEDPSIPIDVALESQCTHDEVMNLLSKLSDIDRQVLVLVYLEGLTYIEAGEAIGISKDAVRMRLFRLSLYLRRLPECRYIAELLFAS